MHVMVEWAAVCPSSVFSSRRKVTHLQSLVPRRYCVGSFLTAQATHFAALLSRNGNDSF